MDLNIPYLKQAPFSVRLEAAKKLAIDTALAERAKSIQSVAAKAPSHDSGTRTGRTIEDVNSSLQSPLEEESPSPSEAIKSASSPFSFKLATSYAALKSAGKRKRPADSDVTDPSPLTSKRKAFQTTMESPAGPKTPSATEISPIRTAKRISEWYDSIDLKAKFRRGDLVTLQNSLNLVRRCEDAHAAKAQVDLSAYHSELRTLLHRMEFYDFLCGILIRKSHLLEDQGLPAIFDSPAEVFPWDIRADSLALYRKWVRGQLDPDLFRGIEDKKTKKPDGKIVKSRRFAPDYRHRVSPNYVGEGQLINGMWWPLQFCAMRDGAHGETEAGIHGQIGFGAYSVVVSEGGYKNIDNGTHLEYCGTKGTLGELSLGTKLLKESFAMGHPLRVLRSASLAPSNVYRPARGLRFDGLYEITGFEVIDLVTAMHRFTLERCEGQDPIRYQGVEARPNHEELAAYARTRKLLGLSS